jgi:hypothetical protein
VTPSSSVKETTVKFSKEFALTYPGVVYADSRSFPMGWVGPNLMGERFVPRQAIYDTDTNTTRVVFDLLRLRGAS